jgi:hypothetical protein
VTLTPSEPYRVTQEPLDPCSMSAETLTGAGPVVMLRSVRSRTEPAVVRRRQKP